MLISDQASSLDTGVATLAGLDASYDSGMIVLRLSSIGLAVSVMFEAGDEDSEEEASALVDPC